MIEIQKTIDKILPPQVRTKEQICTVLNAVTAARLVSIPYLYPRLRDNPGENWKKLLVAAASDKESPLALLGEIPKVGKTFKKLGFRKSEFGRLMDPTVDKIFGASILIAGIKSKAIPKSLGYLSLAQKAATAGVAIATQAKGNQPEVSSKGQIAEFITDTGLVACFAAQSIESPLPRVLAKAGAFSLTALGIFQATNVTLEYADQNGFIAPPAHRINGV